MLSFRASVGPKRASASVIIKLACSRLKYELGKYRIVGLNLDTVMSSQVVQLWIILEGSFEMALSICTSLSSAVVEVF